MYLLILLCRTDITYLPGLDKTGFIVYGCLGLHWSHICKCLARSPPSEQGKGSQKWGHTLQSVLQLSDACVFSELLDEGHLVPTTSCLFYLFVPSPFLPRTLIWDKSAEFAIMESAGMDFSKPLHCEYRSENTNVIFSPMALLSLGVSLTPFTQALPTLWQASCSWHLTGKGLVFVCLVGFGFCPHGFAITSRTHFLPPSCY